MPDLDALKRLRQRLIEERVIVEGSTKHPHSPWPSEFPRKSWRAIKIELFVDSPWYIEQPCAEPIDLDRPTKDILESETFCRTQPGFKPVEDWRAAMAERIAAHDRV